MSKQKSVIMQLQEEALDKSVHLPDLLRKAFVVARKLGLTEFQAWIENELNGYSKDTAIPGYREIYGQVRAWNSNLNAWKPVIFRNSEMAEKFSRRHNGQSVAELEALIEGRNKNTDFHTPFSQEAQRVLSKACGVETEVGLFFPDSAVIHTLDSVRNIILNWALTLEEDGILGEGLSFTIKEKSTAESKEYNIKNFYVPINNPQVQQGSVNPIQIQETLDANMTAVTSFLEQLRGALEKLKLSPVDQAKLTAELKTVQAQTTSPKPKKHIAK